MENKIYAIIDGTLNWEKKNIKILSYSTEDCEKFYEEFSEKLKDFYEEKFTKIIPFNQFYNCPAERIYKEKINKKNDEFFDDFPSVDSGNESFIFNDKDIENTKAFVNHFDNNIIFTSFNQSYTNKPKSFWNIFKQNLTLGDNYTFSIPKRIDAFIRKEKNKESNDEDEKKSYYIYFRNYSSVKKFIDFESLIINIDSIDEKGILKTFEKENIIDWRVSKDINLGKTYLRKLIFIKHSKTLFHIENNFDFFLKISKEYSVSDYFENNRIIIPDDRENARTIISFLAGDLFKSPIFNDLYETDNKRPIF